MEIKILNAGMEEEYVCYLLIYLPPRVNSISRIRIMFSSSLVPQARYTQVLSKDIPDRQVIERQRQVIYKET